MNETICSCGAVLKDKSSVYIKCSCGQSWKSNFAGGYIKISESEWLEVQT